jgi:hypothetical protein
MAPGLVFPTLQAVQGLETSRGHGPHAEGGARNARRQEVSTVGFEPWPKGDVAQLGEHLLCKQGVTGSSPVISTSTLSTE